MTLMDNKVFLNLNLNFDRQADRQVGRQTDTHTHTNLNFMAASLLQFVQRKNYVSEASYGYPSYDLYCLLLW